MYVDALTCSAMESNERQMASNRRSILETRGTNVRLQVGRRRSQEVEFVSQRSGLR